MPCGKLRTRPPTRSKKDRNKRRHLDDRLRRAEHSEHPSQEGAVYQMLAVVWFTQYPFSGRLGTKGQGWQEVGAYVQGEYLQDAKGQWKLPAGERPHHERRELGDVVCEVVGQEATHISEGGASLLYGSDDG